MVNNLATTIEKLSFSGNDVINDNHVKTLVERCTHLKVLNLSFTEVTENSLKYISENLMLLEVLHMKLRPTRMSDFAFIKLLQLQRLKVFGCYLKCDFEEFVKEEKSHLKKHLPHLKSFQHNPLTGLIKCSLSRYE